MRQIEIWADERLLDEAMCIYCHEPASTREHAPSRILLDEPYPENLPVVPACAPCNQKWSSDEAYLACLIDCALNGSTDSDNLRAKVKRTFERQPALRLKIEGTRQLEGDRTFFAADLPRVENVILKLARCHYAYEFNDLPDMSPEVQFRPLQDLTQEARASFENVPLPNLWPEVGSRAFIRAAESWDQGVHTWQIVQPGRYRYAVIEGHALEEGHAPEVRIVFSEYLGAMVTWPSG